MTEYLPTTIPTQDFQLLYKAKIIFSLSPSSVLKTTDKQLRPTSFVFLITKLGRRLHEKAQYQENLGKTLILFQIFGQEKK